MKGDMCSPSSSQLNWPEIIFFLLINTTSQNQNLIESSQPRIKLSNQQSKTFQTKKSGFFPYSCFLPPAATGAPGFVGRLESWCSTSQAGKPGNKPVVDEINPRYMLLNGILHCQTGEFSDENWYVSIIINTMYITFFL